MTIQVLIAHAKDEEHYAEQLAGPIRNAGYKVMHSDTVKVGESLLEEASKVLSAGAPVVLCGTIKAVGTRWARRFVNAARENNRGVEVFAVRMEEEADVEQLSLGTKIAEYWQDPARAVQELITSLEKYHPLHADAKREHTNWDAYKQAVFGEHRWVRLAVIAGAKQQDHFTRIPLVEVFVPQMSKTGLPNYDIPDEVLAYKRRLFNPDKPLETSEEVISPEVTAEVTAEDLRILGGASPELILDVLMRERTQVFLGGPGSGKSTLLHYALLLLCDQNQSKEALPPHLQSSPVPFLIELRQYLLKKIPDFVDYIVENSKERYAVLVDAVSLRSLFREEGRALVGFDGLDEVFDPHERFLMIQRFRTFARQYQTHIVVTSRIVGYEGSELGVEQFRDYTLLDFNLQQIRQFVTKWYQYYTWKGEERDAQGLVQRITESPRLMELAGNPLLLTMMAVIYKHRDLPEQRWRLYERCTEVLLEDWEIKGKHIDYRTSLPLEVSIRASQKAEILQRVSLYMLEHGQEGRELNAIAYQPLMTILATYLIEKYNEPQGEAEAIANDILKHLRERTYILAEVGEGIFGFVHRTFMEYFAACYCKAEFNAKKSDYEWLKAQVFGTHWREDNWQEVLLLLIAMLAGQYSPIKEVVDYLRTGFREEIPVNVAFAARCLAETETVEDQQWAQRLLTELVQGISRYAAQPAGREGVATFLDAALSAFSMLAPMTGVPQQELKEQISRLQESKTVRVRIAAWQMGLALRSRQERLTFALAALQDKEEAVRRGAIAALEREWPGKDEVGQALIETVRTDRFATVRQAVLEALQRAWPERVATLDAIESRIERESAYTHIAWLIQYLATNWRSHPKAPVIAAKLANRMRAVLTQKTYNEPNPNIRKAAIEAIGQGWSGNPEILALLTDWAVKDADPTVRRTAIEAIGQGWQGDPKVLALLTDWVVNSIDPVVRKAAIGTIRQTRSQDPETLLLLKDLAVKVADPDIRRTAVEAIVKGWQGDPEILTLLTDWAAEHTDPAVRRAAVEAIGQGRQGDPATKALMRDRAVNDADPKIRTKALFGACGARVKIPVRGRLDIPPIWPDHPYLGRWRHPPHLNPWEDPLHLNPWEDPLRPGPQRYSIRYSLRLGSPGDALDLVIEQSEDPERLALLRNRAINDIDPYIRLAAMKIIVQIHTRDPDILALLTNIVVKDADPTVRRAAVEAIGQGWREDPEILVLLKDLADKDADPTVRRAAAIRVLGQLWQEDPGNSKQQSDEIISILDVDRREF